MNGRSYYRWILSLVKGKQIAVEYTAGHSSEVSIPARMNFEADHYASKLQRFIDSIPIAPVPTFFMDDYTFYRTNNGWIESNIQYFSDHFLSRQTALDLTIGHQQRMATTFYDQTSPPAYPYTRAYSAYSAVIQLYARSGQLALADQLHRRNKAISNHCRFGCGEIEDEHHIFVSCKCYEKWRSETQAGLYEKTERKLCEAEINEVDGQSILQLAKSLFSDGPLWPLYYSFYYLGHVPNIDAHLPNNATISTMACHRLIHHFSQDWHLTAIRLAGRIFGDLQREMARRNGRVQ